LPKKVFVHFPPLVTDFCTHRVSTPYLTVFVPLKLKEFPSVAIVTQVELAGAARA